MSMPDSVHRLDHAGERDRLGAVLAATREPEQRPRQRGGALGDVVDHLQHRALLGVGLLERELRREQLDAEDQVVEVVRDAAGERADRLHPLREPEPALGLGLAGDVEERDHDVRDRRAVEHRPGERADVDVRAVAAVDPDIVDDDDLALGERADERHPILGVRRVVAGVDAVGLRVAADRDVGARRHAHDVLEPAVGVDELTAGRARDPYSDGEVIGQGVDDVLVARGYY